MKTKHTKTNFLHAHPYPYTASTLALDKDHVIVDREDWEWIQDNKAKVLAAPELLEALNEAKLLIRLWHGIHEDIPTERKSWQLYSNSPEMKLINNAIQKATP